MVGDLVEPIVLAQVEFFPILFILLRLIFNLQQILKDCKRKACASKIFSNLFQSEGA